MMIVLMLAVKSDRVDEDDSDDRNDGSDDYEDEIEKIAIYEMSPPPFLPLLQ